MMLTPVALGAQTAKFTPSTPSIVRNCAPSLCSSASAAFAEQVQIVIGQQRRKGVGIVHRGLLPALVGDSQQVRSGDGLSGMGQIASYSPAG